MRVPDLSAELIPGVSAAGFSLGEDIFTIKKQIDQWSLCDVDTQIGPLLLSSEGWVVKESRMLDGRIATDIYFKNELVCLSFGTGRKLYQIVVGKGYECGFYGVMVGDDVLSLEKFFTIEFDNSEDAFYISKDGEDVIGVEFITDYRSSLDIAPHQTIEGIVISNYALARS